MQIFCLASFAIIDLVKAYAVFFGKCDIFAQVLLDGAVFLLNILFKKIICLKGKIGTVELSLGGTHGNA